MSPVVMYNTSHRFLRSTLDKLIELNNQLSGQQTMKVYGTISAIQRCKTNFKLCIIRSLQRNGLKKYSYVQKNLRSSV